MSSGKWKGSTRRARLPKDWPKIRARILKRDGYRCTVLLESGLRCPERATEVDHVIAGDDHADRNLRAICRDHHREKSAHEGATARSRVPLRRPPESHPGLLAALSTLARRVAGDLLPGRLADRTNEGT